MTFNLWTLLSSFQSQNTRGFAAFLTKYTDNNYILHILHILYIIFIRIFALNAPNSWKLMQAILSVLFQTYSTVAWRLKSFASSDKAFYQMISSIVQVNFSDVEGIRGE